MSSVIFVAALAGLPAGCGLSHYQEEMAKQQLRVNSLALDPLQLPEKKNRPAVFLLPPKGISPKSSAPESGILSRFVGQTDSQFLEVLFGAENMKDDDFWPALLRSFSGKEKKDFRANQKLRVEELQIEDSAYTTFVYVRSLGDNRAVIAFRVDRARGNDPIVPKIIDWSLATLTMGQDAVRLQRAYQESKKHAGPDGSRRRESGS
jgi:hypothetical protein